LQFLYKTTSKVTLLVRAFSNFQAVKSKVGKKRKKSHPEEDMSDHCMDKIKKMIGGKGKDSKSDADPVHNKHKVS